jgi:hypothetical protein
MHINFLADNAVILDAIFNGYTIDAGQVNEELAGRTWSRLPEV